MEKHQASIEALTWTQVREAVHRVNPELAAIIDEIDPPNDYLLYRVKYPFGSKIIDKGTLQLNTCLKNKNKLLSINSEFLDKNLKNNLTYSQIPLGLLLNKSSEVSIQVDRRTIPLNFLLEGDLFGVFEVLNSMYHIETNSLWDVSAGARSIFMLAKINNTSNHKRMMKTLNFSCDLPNNLGEHHTIFTCIANSKEIQEPWTIEILFFTRNWFRPNNGSWFKFREFLFKKSWAQSQLLIEKTSLALLWQIFAISMLKRNLKPRPYLVDTVKHLFSIARGVAPGFRPTLDERVAPINLLQKTYLDIYGLKYFPILMSPSFLREKNSVVYYSLNYPTLIEGYPENELKYKIIKNLRDVKYLIETMYRNKNSSKLPLSCHEFMDRVHFEYFHKTSDIYHEIELSEEILAKDTSFKKLIKESYLPIFCKTSPFFTGSIQISFVT